MWSGVERVDKRDMTPEGHDARRTWHRQDVREKDENRPAFVGEATEADDGFHHNGKRELPCRYVQTFGFSAWIVSIMG
jgi:Asp-tRNA(Asn)/Glu-tRNA(Gln) amidotransferase C subunit